MKGWNTQTSVYTSLLTLGREVLPTCNFIQRVQACHHRWGARRDSLSARSDTNSLGTFTMLPLFVHTK